MIVFFFLGSLLKKVTKDHLKDDFDSLFKHLSSDQKSVTVMIAIRDGFFLCPCHVIVKQADCSFFTCTKQRLLFFYAGI